MTHRNLEENRDQAERHIAEARIDMSHADNNTQMGVAMNTVTPWERIVTSLTEQLAAI